MLFSSCGVSQGKELPLYKKAEIPENGVVLAETFRELKESGGIRQFQGETGGIRYVYTVFGREIETARDETLSLRFEKCADGWELAFDTKEGFSFPVTLSIYLNEKTETEALRIESMEEAPDGSIEATPAEGAPVPGNITATLADGKTVLHLALPKTGGAYKIVAGEASENEEAGAGAAEDTSDPFVCGEHECVLMVDCASVLTNLEGLSSAKREVIPDGGIVLARQVVTFKDGESVFDILKRAMAENKIPMESASAPGFNTVYIQGIRNLYEFDLGETSGWMYSVNGWFPNYGCSRHIVKSGDVILWRYTGALGADIGGANIYE